MRQVPPLALFQQPLLCLVLGAQLGQLGGAVVARGGERVPRRAHLSARWGRGTREPSGRKERTRKTRETANGAPALPSHHPLRQHADLHLAGLLRTKGHSRPRSNQVAAHHRPAREDSGGETNEAINLQTTRVVKRRAVNGVSSCRLCEEEASNLSVGVCASKLLATRRGKERSISQ